MKKFILFLSLIFTPCFISAAQTISDGVLSNCMSLKGRYTVPDGVRTIDDFCFFSAEVTEVVISSSVERINNAAFQNCPELQRVIFAEESRLKTIGDDAFSDCPKLREISLPEGLDTMGVRTFFCDESLTKVTLPNTLQWIPRYCFQSNTSLRRITLPDGVRVIAENAFAGCENLSRISFGKGLDSIATKAFYKCLALNEINLPEQLRAIADSAFMRCEFLETITLPASLERVGAKMFRRCPELKEILVAPANKHFTSREGVLYSKDLSVLYEAPATLHSAHYIVPQETQTIYHFAFYECPMVKGIQIPAQIQRIGLGALAMNGMKQFDFTGNERYKKVGESIYQIIPMDEGTQVVFLAHPSMAQGPCAVAYGTTYVADYAMAGCKRMSSLKLPSTLLGMGAFVWMGTDSLKDIYSYRLIPPSLSEETIMGATLSRLQLHVYPQAMAAYMNAPYWQLIVHGDDLTGEEPIEDTTLSVALMDHLDDVAIRTSSDGVVEIDNQCDNALTISLYNMEGHTFETHQLNSGKIIRFDGLSGLYLLSVRSTRGTMVRKLSL